MTKKAKIFLIAAVIFSLAFSLTFAIAPPPRETNKNRNQEQVQTQNQTNSTSTPTVSPTPTITPTPTPKPPYGEKNKGTEHRSRMANFVQSLVHSADRLQGGIGENIRVIAREQNEAKERVGQALEAIENRGKVKSFLIGSDYKNIGQVRSEMVSLRNRLEQLNRLIERVENEGERTELQSQIREMEQERERIENFLKQKENQFSLFGWFVKWLNK